MSKSFFSVALFIMSSGCGQAFGAAGDIPQALEVRRPVRLEVTNQSGGPVEIYAQGSSTSYRVGTVNPGLTGRFAVRPGMGLNGAVEFLAVSGTGGLVRSGPMLVRAGDVVDFALTPHTATSMATVRGWTGGN
jgi:hypothetical protein